MLTSSDALESHSSFLKRVASSLSRFMAIDIRERVWAFLDILDERPALKRTFLIGTPALVVAVGLGVFGYEYWSRANAIHIARQWLDAGRIDRAEIAIQNAIQNEPDLPATWRLASELAWRKGNRTLSVNYAKQAAVVSSYQAADVLAWGDASILTNDAEQAREAESHLDPTLARVSPRALRLAGEIARRNRHYEDARDQFQAALQADMKAGAHSLATDEIPLGIVCLQTGSTGDRTRGQSLLEKWASDPYWGVAALRALLADAVAYKDRVAIAQSVERLRHHPLFTLGDVPVCLKALAISDPASFKAMLDPMENARRVIPVQAAQLLGWLTQMGQAAEAVRWGETLDPADARKLPIAQGIADALRATGRWADLKAWAEHADWGRELGSIGWAYRILAARHLGDGPGADTAWHNLYVDGRMSPACALFVGDSLYAWGLPKEAAALLWEAADRPDLKFQALCTLARLYQMQRDSMGLYRVYVQLNLMRSTNRNIGNNYAYFAALTDAGHQRLVEQIAHDNFVHEPGNVFYRSTYAFVLSWTGQASEALTLMEPVSNEWKTSRAVAWAYGAALASVGRKSEATEVFSSLDPRNLTPLEIAWIQAALR